MKKILLVLLALGCLGCAAAASQTYRATTTQPPSEWQIDGVQSAFGRLQIRINGENVMEWSISVWSGEGRLSGTYQGQSLEALCEKGSGYVRTRCVLTLNGGKMTTLHFRAI